MQWICIAVFALLCCGVVSLFHLTYQDFMALFSSRRRASLKDELEMLKGKPPKGFFGKEFYEVEQILKATGREGKFDFLKKMMLILFAGGVVLALLLNNAYMIPVFGIGLGLAPLWYIRATSAKYKRRLNEDLETALSIVTTSYLRTEDIRQSVRENLEYMTDPVKTYFQEFVIEIDLINANIISALNTLKMKIPNAIFHEWVDTLVTCQSDRNMKHTLTNTVQKFSDVRIVQGELDAMLAEPRREAITMMFLVVSNIPLLYVLNKDWFQSLLFTTQGKIALAICAGIILLAMARIIKLSKPVEYQGGIKNVHFVVFSRDFSRCRCIQPDLRCVGGADCQNHEDDDANRQTSRRKAGETAGCVCHPSGRQTGAVCAAGQAAACENPDCVGGDRATDLP